MIKSKSNLKQIKDKAEHFICGVFVFDLKYHELDIKHAIPVIGREYIMFHLMGLE